MAKKPSAQKSVMQDVHGDVEKRIGDFTDPEKIEAARQRVFDYVKVSEQFGADGLPEEEGIDVPDTSSSERQDDKHVIPSIPSEENEALLKDLELGDDFDEISGGFDAKDGSDEQSGDLSANDFDNLDAIFDEIAQDTPRNVPADDFDEDPFPDTDQSGAVADSDDDFESIFGLPSTDQEPSPFGDQNAKRNEQADVDDILSMLPEDDDEDQENVGAGSELGADENWLDSISLEDEDDSPEVVADETNLSTPVSTPEERDAALEALIAGDDAVMREEGVTDVSDVADPEVVPAVVETKKKKGRFSIFGRKKVRETTQEVNEEGEVEEETTTETITATTPEGEVLSVEENVATVTTQKKRSKLPWVIGAAALLLVSVGAGALLLGQPDYQVPQRQPVEQVGVPALNGDELPGFSGQGGLNDDTGVPALIIDDQDTTPDLEPAISPENEVLPEDVSDQDLGPEAVVIEDITPIGPQMDPSMMPDEPATDDTSVTEDAAEEEISDSAVDALSDLYGVGTSETEVREANMGELASRIDALTAAMATQQKVVDSATTRIQTLEAIVAERDAALAKAQEDIEIARLAAEEAKEMSLEQNNVLIEIVGMRDKMELAESYIVELSKRTASLESDNSDQESIRQINSRITDLTRDMGLVARTLITNERNLANRESAQAAADRAHDEAQAAIDAAAAATISQQTQAAPAGSSGVYENEGVLLALPENPQEIPDDVAIGDEVAGYGEVLDITEMEDGSRLVVMENNSKILPRK